MTDNCHSEEIARLETDWIENPRWKNVQRAYSAEDVVNLRGNSSYVNPAADEGARKLWDQVNGDTRRGYVNCLGAMTSSHAVQLVEAGVDAIYLSGWQIAAGYHKALQERGLPSSPIHSIHSMTKKINQRLAQAEKSQFLQAQTRQLEQAIDYSAPVVADAECEACDCETSFRYYRSLIDAGVSGIHVDDQLTGSRKPAHLRGKVLVPTKVAINKLIAARLAADIADVPTVILGRTYAGVAHLLSDNSDDFDKHFISGEQTQDGFYPVEASIDHAIARGLAFAPHADLIWFETETPDLEQARQFAEAIHAEYGEQLLAYNCSPAYNWEEHDELSIARFQKELAEMGYSFQRISLTGAHSSSMPALAGGHSDRENIKLYMEMNFDAELPKVAVNPARKNTGEKKSPYYEEVSRVIRGGSALANG